jgi:hypothetical protein
MSDFDQNTIEGMFGAVSAPVGFGSGYKRNPYIYSFEKKKARTLANGTKVNSVRGRLMLVPSSKSLPNFFITRTHSVKYGNNKNYIQTCAKAFEEACPTCEWISNVWESSRAAGVPAPKPDAHRAGKLSLNKDVPGDVWMNFYVYEDLQTPDNNNKMFVYRLPAKLRDAYNAAISGGQDPMGRPLESYDPAHPFQGCDIEIYATYTDSKTDYNATLQPRSQMFGGNLEYIMRAAEMTHDIKSIVKEDAQLEKAKSGLEYFLRSYQPTLGGQPTGQQGSPAGLFNGGAGGFFGGDQPAAAPQTTYSAPPPPASQPQFTQAAPPPPAVSNAAAAAYGPGPASFTQAPPPAAGQYVPPPPPPSQTQVPQGSAVVKPKTAFDDLDLLGN